MEQRIHFWRLSFNKAIDERYFMMIWIASEPRFDNLRSDTRFAELPGA